MAKGYVFVRMRKVDFEKIMRDKKGPMEQDLRAITGKTIKIKNTQLFSIAANSTWDLGEAFNNKLIKAVKIKKGDLLKL